MKRGFPKKRAPPSRTGAVKRNTFTGIPAPSTPISYRSSFPISIFKSLFQPVFLKEYESRSSAVCCRHKNATENGSPGKAGNQGSLPLSFASRQSLELSPQQAVRPQEFPSHHGKGTGEFSSPAPRIVFYRFAQGPFLSAEQTGDWRAGDSCAASRSFPAPDADSTCWDD